MRVSRCLVVPLLAACTAFVGCSSSSPRFTSAPAPATAVGGTPSSGDSIVTPEVRREIDEEVRENDKPVDVQSVVLTIASLPSENPAINHRRVIDEILSMLGTPYRFSGTDSLGIDCSGFTLRVYRNAAQVELPRSAQEQFGSGRPVTRDEWMLGDLLFFRTRGKAASHVGVYLGEDLFAHASVSQGVTISSLRSTYYHTRYIGARRIVE